jgi:hypothetical protein
VPFVKWFATSAQIPLAMAVLLNTNAGDVLKVIDALPKVRVLLYYFNLIAHIYNKYYIN